MAERQEQGAAAGTFGGKKSLLRQEVNEALQRQDKVRTGTLRDEIMDNGSNPYNNKDTLHRMLNEIRSEMENQGDIETKQVASQGSMKTFKWMRDTQ